MLQTFMSALLVPSMIHTRRMSVAKPLLIRSLKKDRRNLCEYWKPAYESKIEDASQSDAAKAKLAALFGDTPSPAASTHKPKMTLWKN